MSTEKLREQVRNVLIKFDPVGIYFDDLSNTDEYDSEVNIIVDRLPTCKTEDDVKDMIFNVFKDLFSDQIVKSPESYAEAAKEIWATIKGK